MKYDEITKKVRGPAAIVMAALLSLLFLVGCVADEPAAESDWVIEVTASPTSLDLQANSPGTTEITAFVFNELGKPQAGIGVRFSAEQGSGFTEGQVVQTNSAGIAVNTLEGIEGLSEGESFVVRCKSGSVEGTVTINIGNLNERPTAIIQITPASSQRIGRNVLFSGSQSDDLDGVIVAYDWTINSTNPDPDKPNPDTERTGEGEFTINRTYTNPQQLEVTLKVTDDDGDSNSTTTNYEIFENIPPVADAGQQQTVMGQYTRTGTYICPTVLNGCSSSDEDGKIVTYNWSGPGFSDFVDNNCTLQKTLLAPQTYDITLVVYDDGDGSCTTFDERDPSACPTQRSSDRDAQSAKTVVICLDPNANP